jgi:LysM repeat protein/ABC-type branched-subunit amino acid transport system substrate-binding protein
MVVVMKKIFGLILFFSFVWNINYSFAQVNSHKDSTTIINGKEFYVHKIQKGETLSELAKDYHSTVKEITDANPKLGKNIKAGKYLNIPYKFVKEKPIEMTKDTVKVKPSKPSNETMNIALIMHLNFPVINEDDTTPNKPIFFEEKENANTNSSLEFYEGVMTALDSLKRLGIHLNLHTYAFPDDTSEENKLFNSPEMKKMHLIIAEVFSPYIEKIASYAKANKIPVIYPFSNISLLDENPYTAILSPSLNTQYKSMAKFVSEHYRFDNIIILHTNSPKEKEIDSIYTEIIEKPWANSGNKHTIKHVNIYEKDLDIIKKSLDTAGENIIIVNTADEALAVELISRLNAFRADYDITLIGIPKWENYETLDIDYLQNLDFHWFTATFINQDDTLIKTFTDNFFNKYHYEPTIYSLKGYDIMNYFGNAYLKFNGVKFDSKLTEFKMKGLSTNFDFKKANDSHGMENQYIHIVKYDDYRVKKVNE